MVEKSKTTSGKKKERGLNVRVVQEQKTTGDSKVRVNHNFDKKTTKKSTKKTTSTAKKTVKKAPAKTTAKKTTKKPVAKKPVVKSSVAKSSVAKSSATKKKISVTQKDEAKVEVKTERKAEAEKKIEVVAEKKTEEKVEKKVEKELKKPASFSKNVEEFRKKKSSKAPEVILPKPEKRKSQIILRDVARNRDEIEKQPVKVFTTIPKSEKKAPASQKATQKVTEPVLAPIVVKQTTPDQLRKLTAKEIKEREIKKAISTAKKLPDTSKKRRRKTSVIGRLGWARLTLMITCAATAVFALVYFLSMTSADVSLQVAASQSGINATYPDYVPRGYELSDVTSGSGKVTMNFKSEDGTFMISEEASSWDSDALLSNYIKENYSADEYSVVLEQGLTIYMGNNWEAWVNGGILYKLNVKTGSLTKKQLKTIATSL